MFRLQAFAFVALFYTVLAPLSTRGAVEQASDGASGDSFGYATGQSGNSALEGAYRAKVGTAQNQGAVYLLRNLDAAQGAVTQSAKLIASDGTTNTYFGSAVSLSGSIGLVGAFGTFINGNGQEGAAYVFRNLDTASGTVTQSVKLTASDGAAADGLGSAVSLLGTIGLAGAPGARVGGTQTGAAYVFRSLDTASGAGTESVKLIASDGFGSSRFGEAVSQSGSLGLIGAPGATGLQGQAYVFRHLDTASGTVTQDMKLLASDSDSFTLFGTAVSASGSFGLVGASNAKVGSNNTQGAAYLFRGLDVGTGAATQSLKLIASDGAADDQFGYALSLSGSNGLVANRTGAVYLFRNLDSGQGDITQNVKVTVSGGDISFGTALSLDGDRFSIGTPFAAGVAANTGKAYSGTVSSLTTFNPGSTAAVLSGLSFVSQESWVIGATTSGNQITLSKSDTGTVTATGKGVFIGQSAGASNNTLLIQGAVVANTVAVSTVGATGNKLEIASNGTATGGTVSATGGIVIGNGGTLLLSGATSVTDRLGASTPVTLASGGKFLTGGLSEGSSTAGPAAFGKLTLGGGSSLDFGAGANGSNLLAATGGVSGLGLVSVLNWTGVMGGDSGAAGNDRLLFVTDPGFTTAQLAQFQFFDDSNQLIATGGREFAYNGFTELVPAPEPAVSALLLAAVALPRRPRRASPR